MHFVLGAPKYNQNSLAALLNFSNLTELSGLFGHNLSFKLVFGFGPELDRPLATLLHTELIWVTLLLEYNWYDDSIHLVRWIIFFFKFYRGTIVLYRYIIIVVNKLV